MLVANRKLRAILLAIGTLLAAGGLQAALQIPTHKNHTPAPADPAKDLAEKLPEGASARLGTARLRALCDSIVFSEDGKTIVGVDGGCLVRVWDAATGNLLETRTLPGRPSQLRWGVCTERSADGKTLLIRDRTSLEMRDIPSGKRLDVRLPEELKHIDSIAFSCDRRFLFIVESSDPEPIAGAPNSGSGIGGGGGLGGFMGIGGGGGLGGQLGMLGGSDNFVKKQDLRVWDTATGKQRLISTTGKHRLMAEHDHWLNAPVVSPNGKYLASSSGLGVRVWETASWELAWHAHGAVVGNLTFTPDGSQLIGVPANWKGPWYVWDVKTGKAAEGCQPPKEGFGQSWLLSISPHGNNLLIEKQANYVLWSLKEGKELHHWQNPSRGCRGVFSPDGRSVVTYDTILRRWDVATGEPLYADVSKLGHIGAVSRFFFTADGKRLASIGEDQTIRVWDVPRSKLLHTIAIGDTNFEAWTLTPDGARLIGVDDKLNVIHWSLADGSSPTRYHLDGANKVNARLHVHNIRVTPDGRTLAVAAWPQSAEYEFYKYSFSFWDLETGRLDRWGGEPARDSYYRGAESVLSPDGRRAAYAGQLFDTRTGEIRMALPGNGQGQGSGPHVFSVDGRLLAAGWGDGMRVWEVATARPLIDLPKVLNHRKGFSADGRLLAFADWERVAVYDLATGKTILERPEPEYLRQHGYCATGGVVFSPDGRSVATGHEDGTILFWDMPPIAKPAGELTEREAGDLWDDLTNEDPAKAYAAIWRLRLHPKESIRVLSKHLPPVKRPTDVELQAMIRNLAREEFAEREAALKQLKESGRAAEDVLRQALRDNPTQEQEQRIKKLLDFPEPDLTKPNGEDLRAVRAVAVVEAIDTAAARELLEDWAKGKPGERLTQEASQALTRLKQIGPRSP